MKSIIIFGLILLMMSCASNNKRILSTSTEIRHPSSLSRQCYTQVVDKTAPDFRRIIAFGDSLADMGTYQHAAKKAGGNGRFTTTGDEVWVGNLAKMLNLPLSANRLDGFTITPQTLGGFNYAQGGSRVIEKEGPGKDKGYSMRPFTEQLDLFLSENKTFNKKDLVLVSIGGNDILVVATQLLTGQLKTISEGTNVIRKQVQEIAKQLNRIEKNGNPHIAVLAFPDLSESPKALKNPKLAMVYEALVDAFNNELKDKVKDASWITAGIGGDAIHHNNKTTIIPTYKLDKKVINRDDHCGLQNITETACNVEVIPGRSSLFCGSAPVKKDVKYKFADDIHPSGSAHELIADFAFQHILQVWGIPTPYNK